MIAVVAAILQDSTLPTTTTDQALAGNFDPGVPPPLPTSVSVISITLFDSNDDGRITSNGTDAVNGNLVTAVYDGDTVTINGVTITGTTVYTQGGGRFFTPTDGSVLAAGTVTDVSFVLANTELPLDDLGPPCFVTGTKIATVFGSKSVEKLKVGDVVLTWDHGPQPIRWKMTRTVSGTDAFAPILFRAGALGNSNDLLVSPNHRMLIKGPYCTLFFGVDEVLCPAKYLCDDKAIYPLQIPSVTYVHIMFDRHEIVFSEGIPSESFFANGDYAHRDKETATELHALFPDIAAFQGHQSVAARLSINKYEARLLKHQTINQGGNYAPKFNTAKQHNHIQTEQSC